MISRTIIRIKDGENVRCYEIDPLRSLVEQYLAIGMWSVPEECIESITYIGPDPDASVIAEFLRPTERKHVTDQRPNRSDR